MKKNSIMTTKELAEYIKINEKTVLKMAQKGQLPGVKIGNQWRFHLSTIDAYLQNGIVKSSEQELDSLIKTAFTIIPLSRLIDSHLIILNSKAKTGDEILAELANIAYTVGLTFSKDNLFNELKKREDLLSTAIGNGIAFPHPRYPSPELFNELNIILLRSKGGINFGAPDAKPVHAFFMTCAPNEFIHIRLLAKISKLLHVPDFMKKFMQAENTEQVMQMLLKFDRERMFHIIKS